MSDPPHYGSPVDDLDLSCKHYRNCQRCAQQEFGDMCVGEFEKYEYGEANEWDLVSSLVNFCSHTFFSSVATMQTHVNVPYVSVI